MAHRADGLSDIFEHDVVVRETCAAKKFIGDGSSLTGVSGGDITNLDGGRSDETFIAVGMSPIDGGDST